MLIFGDMRCLGTPVFRIPEITTNDVHTCGHVPQALKLNFELLIAVIGEIRGVIYN